MINVTYCWKNKQGITTTGNIYDVYKAQFDGMYAVYLFNGTAYEYQINKWVQVDDVDATELKKLKLIALIYDQ